MKSSSANGCKPHCSETQLKITQQEKTKLEKAEIASSSVQQTNIQKSINHGTFHESDKDDGNSKEIQLNYWQPSVSCSSRVNVYLPKHIPQKIKSEDIGD